MSKLVKYISKQKYAIWLKVCGHLTITTLTHGPSPTCCHKIANIQLTRISLHAGA